VLSDVIECHPTCGIGGKHARDQVCDLLTNKLWYLVLGIQNLLVKLSMILILERKIATNQREKDHTATPNIDH
jgi:hypothetical protein